MHSCGRWRCSQGPPPAALVGTQTVVGGTNQIHTHLGTCSGPSSCPLPVLRWVIAHEELSLGWAPSWCNGSPWLPVLGTAARGKWRSQERKSRTVKGGKGTEGGTLTKGPAGLWGGTNPRRRDKKFLSRWCSIPGMPAVCVSLEREDGLQEHREVFKSG